MIKKSQKKLILILLFSILWIGFKTYQDNNLVFQRENQRIEVKFSDGRKYLKWNEKNTFKLKVKNIDLKKLNLSAPGLKLSRGANDVIKESILEITPDKKYNLNDTLILFVNGRDKNDSLWFHKFKILIK
jgi:hypothetical protein